MLILLVSVTSWTTELALKALDAEIDAAEKAADSTALVPRLFDALADEQLERRAAATPEDGNNLLASLNECQQKHFGLGKMSEECTQAIQNAIQSKVDAVGPGLVEGMAKLVEEARTEALKSPDCGKSYQKPWWPLSKDDPLSAQDPPIFKNKRVTGTAKTLEVVAPRQRFTSNDFHFDTAETIMLNLKDISAVHSCAHTTKALAPTLSNKHSEPDEYADPKEPKAGWFAKKKELIGSKLTSAKSNLPWATVAPPKSVCDEDKGVERTNFLGRSEKGLNKGFSYLQEPPASLKNRELAVVIKMKSDYELPEGSTHHVTKGDCPVWLQGPGVCYYLTCDALLGTFCSGDEDKCETDPPLPPTTWGWLSKRDLKAGVRYALADEQQTSEEWINTHFRDNGCPDYENDGCRSVCRSAMESFVDLMNAYMRTAGGGAEATAEVANTAQTYMNVLGYVLESSGGAALDSLNNAVKGGAYLSDATDSGVEVKKDEEALAEDQVFDKGVGGGVNSGNAKLDARTMLAMKTLACAGGVALTAATGGMSFAAAPLFKPCISVMTGGMKMAMTTLTDARQKLVQQEGAATLDPWGEKLAQELAWVDQYSAQVTSLLNDQHGEEADPANDPKLQFMLANTQTLTCAVEKVGAYVENSRLQATPATLAEYEKTMEQAKGTFLRIVEQVQLALQINGQANVQKLVEKAKDAIVEELKTTKTEIMGKIDGKLTKDEPAKDPKEKLTKDEPPEDSMDVPSSSHTTTPGGAFSKES